MPPQQGQDLNVGMGEYNNTAKEEWILKKQEITFKSEDSQADPKDIRKGMKGILWLCKERNVEIYFSGLKRTIGEVIKAVRADYIAQEIALKVQY